MKSINTITLACLSALTVSAASFAKDSVEVLHGWSSGGEAAALQVLKDNLDNQGIGWEDLSVAGAAGANARNYLRVRAAFGNPPTAVVMGGYTIRNWAQEGVMANLDAVAKKEGWENKVPPALKDFSKHDGHWVASPVGIHRINWIWANKRIFDTLGLDVPTTFPELIQTARTIRAAGYLPFAAGGQAWQETTIFDSAVVSAGGVELYQKAFGDMNIAAIKSPEMIQAFNQLGEFRTWQDEGYTGRDWNVATKMVIDGKAAMQVMGDWAKGEFINTGKVPDKDFLCFDYPGTQGSFIFNADQFGMFAVSQDKQKAQQAMATAIMQPEFQIGFNKVKGSIPPNMDISPEAFDACAQKSMQSLKSAVANNKVVGSIAHTHMVPAEIQTAIYTVVNHYMNSDMSSYEAAQTLGDAIEFLK
ncbi:sugar ABC transporter substrate-binding protein [Vibrio sp. HA2012]|uniref:ABC transporter substrate-binding protein n=1 Tax=Vibrio sp. HA2012 TaxID=1971595 RepID=UPI000C2C228E|nr:ABC transporter substrate-binding protein [Vibrio sp. HA2012]PJC86405.1 sugar ABC transporter substrate-binding protein [Vibrio sp. HA2012]